MSKLMAVSFLIAAVVGACAGTTSGVAVDPTAVTASSPPDTNPAAVASGSPFPLMQGGMTEPGRQFAALANALNLSMAALPEPDRTLEQVTAAYGMQAEIMGRFVDGLIEIDWPPLIGADAAELLTLALRAEFYDAALSRAPSMSVVETLEAARDTAMTGWQDAVDALSRDLGVGSNEAPS